MSVECSFEFLIISGFCTCIAGLFHGIIIEGENWGEGTVLLPDHSSDQVQENYVPMESLSQNEAPCDDCDLDRNTVDGMEETPVPSVLDVSRFHAAYKHLHLYL